MDHHDEGTSGIPWLSQPVMLHSSREDECTLTPEQCEYRRGYWRYWYEADHVYALGTVYFMCAVIGIFAILHFIRRLQPQRNQLSDKSHAAVRFLSYRGFHIRGLSWYSSTVGVVALIAIGILFFSIMTLGPKPYYWPNTRTVSFGNSPPIATRAGWMAVALLPFVMALAAKANMISALTGISHEKLQVFHHWASYAMFVLALVHTFPFIVHHIWKGDMELKWDTDMVYWTGVVALIFQAYLTVMSLPVIRNRHYEFFKATHFAAALVFILFFFIHCDFRLTSWDYFIATGAIYLASLFYSQIKTFFENGVHTATVDLIAGGFVRVTIPTHMCWKPGQHVFIRFLTLGIHSFTAHPFTICSLPHESDKCGRRSKIILYIQPQRGITARLAKLAEGNSTSSVKVLIEGPYGGLGSGSLGRFDTSVVISGGSGAGFSLAVAEDAMKHHRYVARKCCCQTDSVSDVEAGQQSRPRIHILYAARQVEVAEWYEDAVKDLVETYSPWSDITASIHITTREARSVDESAPPSPDGKVSSDPEKGGSNPNVSALGAEIPPTFISPDRCRPNVPETIARFLGTGHGIVARPSRSIGIAVCGPASLLHDVRNAAADAQREVISGKNGLAEVSLHSERFSW